MALSFDGVDDEVNFGDVLDKERTDPFSVDWWMFTTAPDQTCVMVGKRELVTANRGYEIFIRGNVAGGSETWMRFNLLNDGGANGIQVDSDDFEPDLDSKWLHFCATYDGSSTGAGVAMYVNAVAKTMTVASDTLNATTVTGADLKLARRDNNTEEYAGIMMFTRIWNVELSADQVKVARLRPRFVDERVDLAVMLDEQAGSTAHDLRQVNDGTITGAAWAEGPPVTPLVGGVV